MRLVETWAGELVMQCKKKAKDGSGGKCKAGATDCCVQQILDLQVVFRNRSPSFRRSLRLLGTCTYSFQSSIVN
jgi:hypothetical protein